MDFLSKWIKNDRDQIETDDDIDIGLKVYQVIKLFLANINLILIMQMRQCIHGYQKIIMRIHNILIF